MTATTCGLSKTLAGDNGMSRVDMARLRSARPKSPGGVVDPNGWLALGGLSRLLTNLDGDVSLWPSEPRAGSTTCACGRSLDNGNKAG